MTKENKAKKLTREDIQRAKEVNLVDYCLTNNIPLLRPNTRNPSLEEHDSLVFYPDNKNRQWNRHSTGQGGDAIDFIRFYESRHLPEGEEVSFQYAVNKLLDNDYESVPKIAPSVPDFEYENNEVNDFTRARGYLVNERGINEGLVSALIDEGIIAQDKRNNVVFKWVDYDLDGKVVGANEQGTGKVKDGERSFKKTQRYSTNGKGFNLRIGEPENIKFFESAIDLLSYADIHQKQMENEWLVSMEGLKHTVVMETLTSCSRYSKEHGDYHIESVSFCVDNDEVGKEFADKYVGKLSIIDPSGNKPFTLEIPEKTKDWNDELLYLKEGKERSNLNLVNVKGETNMKHDKVYVNELESEQIAEIESALREAITDTGHYSDSEIEEHVQRGLDSKIHDLEDTIPVYDIMNGKEESMSEKHIYIYNGLGEPEKVESFEEISIESNYLGDMTDEFQEEYEWHVGVDSLEEIQENQFFSEYGVWVNPTRQQLEKYNDSIGLDKEEHLRNFEGHEQLFEDRETNTYLDLDDELEL